MDDKTPDSSAPDIDSHRGAMPRHLAIIMDGNNRWARRRGLPGADGHRAGERTVQKVIRRAARHGVEVVTLFAFSSENWRRPEDEVNHLMGLFVNALGERVDELHGNGVRLRFIGDRDAFAEPLRAGMAEAEARTAGNDRMTLVVAVNYGGQWDLAQAAAVLARDVRDGKLDPADIDAAALDARVSTADLPPLDLLIRTGGERRLSNFLLWQAAYAELYFTPALWPDFDGDALDAALEDYAGRQRRFGRSGEQVDAPDGEQEC
ncbi:polyprenyl diphosphate synthase [Alloalcanivorax profundimaris]|uniref:polyprenyl diphosphate synthase n=1 Tax=Alloalcanivorax profundimaris TaxID=2735259 RepID=UPI001887B39F|nr:polyprenyl diphosphate synthase [Alloalcanivorax profundimaris]MBF1800395.1 di-trans,poly-cis-decaprenylcistransferase [Alloalcanivorax profundimaris]MCQ6263717.1 polyprenyl diphosphate synthase [Alcanivorax sp. MM125-6]